MRVSKAALAVVFLSFAVTNCGDPAEKAAEAASGCGKRSCPSGTRPEETRALDASSDISGGYDPATYKAEGAYKRSGSGSCEYACVVTQACPEGTFPIINEEFGRPWAAALPPTTSQPPAAVAGARCAGSATSASAK